MKDSTIDQLIGQTPLMRLNRMPQALGVHESNRLLLKLEGQNPAGSVKDRAAFNMIHQAELRGDIKPGDALIEATSGNTGIALAMVAAMKGYRMVLIMPENLSVERRLAMSAYGAKLILVSQEEGMEGARDMALEMQKKGEGKVLDQFNNTDNAMAHYHTTGPEIWARTEGKVTHFVSAMGTTGTIMGTSKFLKEQNPNIQIIGLQPKPGASIAGIRRWPEAYMPGIYCADQVDHVIDIGQEEAVKTTRQLAREEGLFCGVSSGGNVHASLSMLKKTKDAVMVTIICDRGDRYLSTGLFDD